MCILLYTIKHKAPAVVGIACLARDLCRDPVALTRWFKCPICGFRGPFTSDYRAAPRRYARCPGCGGTERHRLQYMVFQDLRQRYPFKDMRMLHFAPETVFRARFRDWFASYETADINTAGDVAHRVVDRQLDLRDMSAIADGSFDIVVASHVLEHVKEDEDAISEVARVLSPGGIAVLPVPLVAHETIEYPHPVPTEFHHVRAPGLDYFDRYKRHFERVEVYTSEDFGEEFQTWSWDDRTAYPNQRAPYRKAMPGKRHPDAVPVCFK
jgi:SAM-dependent methyltransferase